MLFLDSNMSVCLAAALTHPLLASQQSRGHTIRSSMKDPISYYRLAHDLRSLCNVHGVAREYGPLIVKPGVMKLAVFVFSLNTSASASDPVLTTTVAELGAAPAAEACE